jgi:hypothetical protein
VITDELILFSAVSREEIEDQKFEFIVSACKYMATVTEFDHICSSDSNLMELLD